MATSSNTNVCPSSHAHPPNMRLAPRSRPPGQSSAHSFPLLAGLLRAAQALRRHIGRLILVGFILLLFAAGLSQAHLLPGLFPANSLRYGRPFSGQQAANARQYAIDNPDSGFWPTFWREEVLRLESGLHNTTATCLVYSGTGALVWPAAFITGTWPGATDFHGCSISQGLAHQLWGSTDVLGMTLTIDGQYYTVRGVFAGEQPLCLAQTTDKNAGDGWQAVELSPTGTGDISTAQAAQNFALASGLGQPDTQLNGSGLCLAAILACWLPPALLVLCFVLCGLHRLYKAKPLIAAILALAAALLLAVALPALLNLLPAWLIPTQWSDFSHWGNLLGQAQAALTSLLALQPALRDVQGKQALLAAAAATLLACPLALWLACSRLASRLSFFPTSNATVFPLNNT